MAHDTWVKVSQFPIVQFGVFDTAAEVSVDRLLFSTQSGLIIVNHLLKSNLMQMTGRKTVHFCRPRFF